MADVKHDASEKGRADAKRDIAEKRLRLFSGAPSESAWGGYLADTMRQRFAVEIVFTSCLTHSEKEALEEGFNDEVIAYIDRAFGAGAYARAYDDVQRWRKARYDEWFAANQPGSDA